MKNTFDSVATNVKCTDIGRRFQLRAYSSGKKHIDRLFFILTFLGIKPTLTISVNFLYRI